MQIAQVVPDLATFAVDDGFSYAVPNGTPIGVGSIVRVPLGNRRVRGFVVGTRDGDTDGLKKVAAVSGDMPVFDERLLQTLRWASLHYVAPLSVLLGKASPPNLPRRPSAPTYEAVDARQAVGVGAGRTAPLHLDDEAAAVSLAAQAAGRNNSCLLVASTVVDAIRISEQLGPLLGARVATAWSQMSAAAVTKSWARLAGVPGTVLVGTREAAWWPAVSLEAAIVVDDGRRGHKDRQTPTAHARDVLRRRGAVERFLVATTGRVPTTDAVGAGFEVMAQPGRLWPLVEVVDRSEDPPGSGVVGSRARSAIRSTAGRGEKTFVLCRTRGFSVRCVRCRALRQCVSCQTTVGRSEKCPRCETVPGSCVNCGSDRFEPAASSVPQVLKEVATVVGGKAGLAGSSSLVEVGTERDMPEPGSLALAVAVDGDGWAFAPHFRAAEDAVRLMARLAGTVRKGRSNRALVQTSVPEHRVYEALRRGSADTFLGEELELRTKDGFPPAGELMAVEIEGEADAHAELEQGVAGEGQILGPAVVGSRTRWLIAGSDLRRVKIALRPVVQSWREAKTRVRIDADPIDL